MNKTSVGRQGEEVAIQLLRKKGYRILDRNVKARFGEIDLVAKDGRTLCFVEVKAATDLRCGFPEEWITERKKWRLSRLALWYLKLTHQPDVPIRFDVVSILLEKEGKPIRSRLIQGAFEVNL